MAFEDLNPYAAAGLKSFNSRTLSAMDAVPDIPRVDDNYAGFGVNQLDISSVDPAALGQALVRPTPIKEPSVGFNQNTNQLFVNGLMFDVNDYQTAEQSATPQYLNREPTGLPDGFRQIQPETYANYIKSIKDPGRLRLMGKNFLIGVDNFQMLGGAGTAFLGDAIGSEKLSDYGRDVVEQNVEDLRRKQPFQRAFTDIDVFENEGGSGAIDWFLANLAQQGPNLLESISIFLLGATGATLAQGNPLTGMVTGVGAALSKGQLKKRVMELAAKRKRGEAFSLEEQRLLSGLSGVALSLANNYRTGVSDVYLELLESAEMKDPGIGQRFAALVAGAPYAAAETFSEAFVMSKFFDPVGASSRFRRVLGGFTAGAAAEGATEGFQESLVMGTDAALNKKELLTEQNGIRLLNSIAAGAAVGGPISGLSGFRGGDQEVNLLDNQTPTIPTTPTDTQDPQGPAQGELFPDADLGTARTRLADSAEVLLSDRQGELFPPDTDFGVGAEIPVGSGNVVNPQLNLFDQPVIPSQQPGYQMNLPFPPQGSGPVNPAVQLELPLTAPVGTQSDLFNQNLPFPPPPPPPPRREVQLRLPLGDQRLRKKPAGTPFVADSGIGVVPDPVVEETAEDDTNFFGMPSGQAAESLSDVDEQERNDDRIKAREAAEKEAAEKEAAEKKAAEKKANQDKGAELREKKKDKVNLKKGVAAKEEEVKEEVKEDVPPVGMTTEEKLADLKDKIKNAKGKEKEKLKLERSKLLAQQAAEKAFEFKRDKSANLKKGKSGITRRNYQEGTIQGKPVDRTQLLKDGNVVADVMGTGKDLNLRKRKVDTAKTTAATATTTTPQDVEVREAVVMSNPDEQWDANRPDEDAPKAADFPENQLGKIRSLTAEEMRDAWTDPIILGTLPQSVRSQILIHALDDMKLPPKGSPIPQNLEEFFTMLLEVALPKGGDTNARKWLTTFKLKRPELRDAVAEVVTDKLALGELNTTDNTLWFTVAENVGALPTIKRLLKNDAAVASYTKLESAFYSNQQQIDNNIIATTEEITELGGMSAALYKDSTYGPKKLAERLATALHGLPDLIRFNRKSPKESRMAVAITNIERLYQGISGIKPDLTFTYKGIPLSDYFDASGKLKTRPHETVVYNRNGRRVKLSGFKLSPVDMQTNRELNKEAAAQLNDDKLVGKIDRELEEARKKVRNQEEFEAMYSGYIGNTEAERAQNKRYAEILLANGVYKLPSLRRKRGPASSKPNEFSDFGETDLTRSDDVDLDNFFKQVDTKTEDGNTLLFEGDTPIKAMSVGKATLLAKSFVNKLVNKPTLTVVRDVADLKITKPALFERVLAARPEVETTLLSGMSIGKDIIIFSDFIKGDKHLRFTLAHEAMGHFGLRSLVKDSDLNKFLDDIYNSSDYLRQHADTYMETHGTSKYIAIEEAMANYVATLETNLLAKIMVFIGKALSKFNIKIFHDDAPYIVNQLRRYVRNGEIPGGVSAEQIAANIAALNDSNVGRFSVAFQNMATGGLGEFFTSSGDTNLKKVVQTIGRRKFLDNLGRGAEQVQTLDNMANKSLGLSLMFDIFRRQAQTAKSIMSELDQITAIASKARWLGLNSNALTKQEESTVGKLLAYGNKYTSQNLDPAKLRALPNIIVSDPITGRPIINNEILELAMSDAVLTDDQIRNGFNVETAGIVEPARDEEGKVVRIEGFDPVNNPRHKIIKEAYYAQRRAINYASARVALGKYLASIKQYEANAAKIKSLSDEFTQADLNVFDEILKAFTKIYQQGARDSDGKVRPTTSAVRDAEAFINGVTRALWQDGAIQDLEAMQTSDSPSSKEQTKLAINVINNWNSKFPDNKIEMSSIVSGLKRMRKYELNDPASGIGIKERTRDKLIMEEIQQPLKNQVFTETQLLNADIYAKGTMFTGYIPFRRSGKKQLRFQAYTENGKPTKINAMFANAFPYYQDDNKDKLDAMRDDFNKSIENTVFQVPANDEPDAPLINVRMQALVEDTSGGASSVTAFNYDEFANVLNNLGVQLSLEERERIVLELSKQHDKAREGLQKDFVRGWDEDVFRSVAEHLESQAAVAAKNEHRIEIDTIMSTTSNWNMPKKMVEDQYAELLRARNTNNVEFANIAQEKFDKLLRMYMETAPDNDASMFTYIDKYGKERTIRGKGKAERYKTKSAELLEFYARTGDIAISAEDAFAKSDTLSQFKSIAVLFQLGGNIASGLVNLTSLPLMAMPLLATYNQKTGIGGGYGFMATGAAITRATGNLKGMNWGKPEWIKKNVLDNNSHASYGLTKDEAQFIYRQTARGILDAALVNSLAGRARGNFFQNGTATAVSRGYMTAFAYTEQLNRRVTALATYRLEKKRRMAANPQLQQGDFLLDETLADTVLLDENPDLFYVEEKVNEMVTKSQGDYAMYNRPPIARGYWTQYLYMYKQFQVIATQLVRVLPPSGRLYYLGLLTATAGLKGLPGAEDLLDIIDTLKQKFGKLFGLKASLPAELALGKVVSDLTGGILTPQDVLRGFVDRYMGGGTISSRLSIGDLFPMTGIFLDGASIPQELKNFAGPLYSAATGGAVMAYDLAMLPTKTNIGNELLRIGQKSPIAGLRNIADTAMYHETGNIVNSRGYTVSKDLTLGVMLTRLIGFYPKAASRTNDAIKIVKRIVENAKSIATGYRDDYVRAYIQNDRIGMRDVERAVKEHNKVYKGTPFFIDDFRGKARRAAKSAKEGGGERYLKTTPKSNRDQIKDIMENFFDVNLS